MINRRDGYPMIVLAGLLALLAGLLPVFQPSAVVRAHPYPPTTASAHYAPVAWPSSWIAYTYTGSNIRDQKVQDPSNGGTSPQNYANVSSGCTDQVLPSIYYGYDATAQVIFFRWRVEQIANTYATGPSAGSYRNSDPWNAGQWTVLVDTDGDGYREFAMRLEGGTGTPDAPIDMLQTLWSNEPSHSVDYTNPSVKLVAHNPTAFVDPATGYILNYHNSLTPDTIWPNSSAETVWDYGTTRATLLPGCGEYLIDYQIPLGMLDARSVGGTQITPDTPIQMAFATANSNTNPFQKDFVYTGDFIATVDKPVPFGDVITLSGKTQSQPIIETVTTSPSCVGGTVQLTAQVRDALKTDGTSTVNSVTFYAYTDTNGNGQADDGGSWQLIATGSTTNSPIGRWTASWNAGTLMRGQYLLGAQALDEQGNRTYSYLSALPAGATAKDYLNPTPVPGVVTATYNNSCGTPPPSISKSASPATVVAGQPVTFTVTINNPTASAITVNSISDTLPPGFRYSGTLATGTLGSPSTSPAANATGTIQWTFSPAASVPGASTRTLLFTATSPTAQASYNNLVSASTSYGTLTADPAAVAVGAPRLTIAKAASTSSVAPGGTIDYTITYANDSPVSSSNVVITDVVPLGLSYVSGTASAGGSYNSAARMLTWTIGSLPAGSGQATLTYRVSVDNPYPATANIPVVNVATITSSQTSPASATASVYVSAPRPALVIQKNANKSQVDPAAASPGNQISFTISYANVGNATASSVVVTDTIPAGFTFVSAPVGTGVSVAGTGVSAGGTGTVTWNIGTLNAGQSGTVTLNLQASNPYTGTRPATNTAWIRSATTATVSDSFMVAITRSCSTTTTYYFRTATTNVGAAGTQRVANTTAPIGISLTPASATLAAGTSAVLGNWYQDPAQSSGAALVAASGSTLATVFLENLQGGGSTFTLNVLDYNPTTGAATSFITSTVSTNGNTPVQAFNFLASSAINRSIGTGNRLLWRVSASNTSNNTTQTINLYYDTTTYQSRASLCLGTVNTTVNKTVNALVAQPSGSLQYTVAFDNPSPAAVTGATVVDTLPAGVTFTSATLNGAATSASSVSGRTYTFAVSSSGQPAGTIAAGASGTLVINVTVDAGISANITTLLNRATLNTAQTSPTSDTASSTLARSVAISKSVDKSSLLPGETVTFRLTALNTGTATYTNVTISDVLPTTAYFTYVPGSTTVDGAPVADSVGGSPSTLTYNLGSMAPGTSKTVTFRMRVATSGVPSGVTTLSNTGSVRDDQTAGSRNSETVYVAITANPNLTLAKTSSPSSGPLAAGALLTYTLTVGNSGASDASSVMVLDPIPANTSYVAGTLAVASVSRTDANDGDGARFEAANNRVVFSVGTLAAGASQTLRFTVRLGSPLPNGTTTIANTATASAGNAASKQASASITASAAPQLGATKSAPAVLSYPLTTLAGAASASTVIAVVDSSEIRVGDVILVGGVARTVSAISGTTVTLDGAVSAASGAAVLPTFVYSFAYQNSGTATATSAQLQDTLPGGLLVVSCTGACSQSGSTITWNLGTLTPGSTGNVSVRVQPTATGSYVNNTAKISSTEVSPVSINTTTTIVGSLKISKRTSTSVVSNTATGVQATYAITVENQLASSVGSVVVSDALPPGFAFASTVGISNPGGSRSSTIEPSVGDTQPSWGTFSIAGGAKLVITFKAQIAANVTGGTYQNPVRATGGINVIPFDELGTTAEDVTVQIRQVSGKVFVDADSDGVQDPGENGLAGVTMELLNSSNQVVSTTTTATDGSYLFTPSTAGTYTVRETNLSAYPVSTTPDSQSVNVPSNGYAIANFGDKTAATAIDLLSFTATPQDKTIVLRWETATEVNTRGFHLLRSATGQRRDAVQITPELIPGQGSSVAGAVYTWTDTTTQAGVRYTYYLQEVETGGRVTEYISNQVMRLDAATQRIYLPLIIR